MTIAPFGFRDNDPTIPADSATMESLVQYLGAYADTKIGPDSPTFTGTATFTGTVVLPAVRQSVRSASVGYAVGATDQVAVVDATAGSFAVFLPAATGTGRSLAWRAITAGANVVVITPHGTDTIDGAGSATVGGSASGATWIALDLIDAASAVWRSL